MFKGDDAKTYNDAQTNDYLQRNMGWALTKSRDVQLATAISDPATFLGTRQGKIDALFKAGGSVDLKFKTTYKLYSDKGLPDDIARDYAMKHARQEYDLHLDLLEMEAPGAYQRAFGGAQITRDAKDAVVNIATGGETLAEYKARKNANKSQLAIQ